MSTKKISLAKGGMILGNLFEHYDTALFSLLSPFLAPLFFPKQDPLMALLLTYAIIPLGMIARPIGALFFGYIGDTKGRKQALMLSLSGMAIVTACIGFIPTYQQAGVLAPVLLSFSRLLQNFFASGENVGGAIYLMEHSSDTQQDWLSGLFSASTVAGILLASFGVSVLCLLDVVYDYWRLLYYFGCLTALCAYGLRTQAEESLQSTSLSTKNIFKVCWEQRSILLTIAVAAGFSYVSYTIALVSINGFIPLISKITKEEMMHYTTFLLVVDFLLLPIFGLIAQRFSREKMMIGAGLVAAISGFPLFFLLNQATVATVIFVRFILVIIGVWFSAPFYAWAQNLISPAHRYTLLSFGYAIGSQLFGGPGAAISLWLFHQTGLITSLAWYWMGLGLLSSVLILRQRALAHQAASLLAMS
jgi:MFS transporter, MHS family, proline/betaine transporter